MTTRRQSPGPSEYSTSYRPREAYWHPRMSRSPTLSDSRYEHHSPRDRVYPTMDIQQPLYTEFRNMLREHRRQEDEARDSLIKQIRDHREQQDDLLLRIAMLSSRTFDEGNTIDYRPSTSRREATTYYSMPRETMELDSVLGSQINPGSQYLPAREDSEETQDARPTIEANKHSPDRDRARSKTARPAAINSDDETTIGESSSTTALRNDLPIAKPAFTERAGKRKSSELGNAEAAPKWREMLPPPKRKAAMYASKKNHDTLKFYRQNERQQSLALKEGRASAITTSCLCSQLTCKICGPLAKLKQDSREQKWR